MTSAGVGGDPVLPGADPPALKVLLSMAVEGEVDVPAGWCVTYPHIRKALERELKAATLPVAKVYGLPEEVAARLAQHPALGPVAQLRHALCTPVQDYKNDAEITGVVLIRKAEGEKALRWWYLLPEDIKRYITCQPYHQGNKYGVRWAKLQHADMKGEAAAARKAAALRAVLSAADAMAAAQAAAACEAQGHAAIKGEAEAAAAGEATALATAEGSGEGVEGVNTPGIAPCLATAAASTACAAAALPRKACGDLSNTASAQPARTLAFKGKRPRSAVTGRMTEAGRDQENNGHASSRVRLTQQMDPLQTDTSMPVPQLQQRKALGSLR